MTVRKMDLVPLEEVARRYKAHESLEVINRDLRKRGINVSTATLYKALRDAGERTDRQQGGARPTPIPNLRELAQRHERGENLRDLAEESGVDASTLLYRMEQTRRKPPRKPPKVISNLEELAQKRAQGQSLASLAREAGVSSECLSKKMKDAGLWPHNSDSVPPEAAHRSPGRPPKEIANLEDLVQRYNQGRGEPLSGLAREAGLSSTTLLRRMRKAGLVQLAPLPRVARPVIDGSYLKGLAQRYNQGRGEPLSGLAREAGVSSTTLLHRMRKAGLVQLAPLPRMAQPAIDGPFLVCRRIKGSGRVVAASVHRADCRRAPTNQQRCAGSEEWLVEKLDRMDISKVVKVIEERSGVNVALRCMNCGGWSGDAAPPNTTEDR